MRLKKNSHKPSIHYSDLPYSAGSNPTINRFDRVIYFMRKDLQIASDIQNLRLVEKLIDELSIELDLSDESYGNVLVATMEATNNAIVHGNKLDPEKVVVLKVLLEKDQLVVNITDQGVGFNPKVIPDPTAPENIEKINGRGIFLMERLSDEIQFLDEGRVVELKFKV